LGPSTTATDVDAVDAATATDWSGLAGIWGIYFSFGLVSGSFAPVITEVREELGIDAGRMGLLLGLWQLVYFAASVPVSKLIDRLGLTWSLTIAGSLMAASAFLRAGATNYPVMLVAVVLFGLGGPFISIGAPQFVAMSFGVRRRARAVSVYVTAPPLGATVAAAGTQSVLIPLLGGWRAAFVFHGAFAVASTVVWATVRGRRRRAARPHPSTDTAWAPRTTTRGLLRIPSMWALAALACTTFAVNHALGSWLVELLRASGFDETSAGTVASIPVLVGIVAALVIPRLAAGSRRTPTIVTVQIVGAVALLALLDPYQWGLALAVPLVAIGCLRASALPLATLMIMDDVRLGGVRAAGSVGMYFAVGELGGLVGPLAAGLSVDRTGSFDAVVWGLFVLSLVGAVIGAVASRSTRRVS
jgi:CP family cyanate transporter-like MFS transporter